MDCEFEERDGYEWYCTTHAVLMIARFEPVLCTEGWEEYEYEQKATLPVERP